MRTPRLPLLAAPLLVTGLLALPPAAQAATGCDGVRGRDLAPGAAVKVVDRGTAGRHRYVACGVGAPFAPRRLPLARAGERITVLDVRGGVLAYRGATSDAVAVHDLRRGTGRRLVRAGRRPLGRVLVSASGGAVALFRTTATQRTLVGHDGDGTPYTLDRGRIPVASLRHDGPRIRWTREGRVHRSDLRVPRRPCDRVAGRQLRRTATIRVLEVVFADEFLAGELNGRTAMKLACARPDGPVRILGEDTVASGGIQGGSGLTVLATGGSSVVTRAQTASSGEEVATDLLRRVDLRTGTSTPLWGNEQFGGPRSALGELTQDPIVVLTPSARTGLVFETLEPTPRRRIVVFEPDGTPRTLDEAPAPDIDPASLALAGSVLSWRNAGALRSVDVDAPPAA